MTTNKDKINVLELTKHESYLYCRTCIIKVLEKYPNALFFGDIEPISCSDSPQYYRWWLIKFFPNEFYIGKQPKSIIGGHSKYRGISKISHKKFI
jgi:hypothetical protein